MGYRLFAVVVLCAGLLARVSFAEAPEDVSEPELSSKERYERAMGSAQASMRSANETVVSAIAAYEARLAAEAAAREAAEAAAREAAALAAKAAADSAAAADTAKTAKQPAPVMYTLSVVSNPANGGTVSRNPDLPRYVAGTRVVMNAAPAAGYRFVKWTNPAGRTVSENPNLGGLMDRNMVLTANFELLPKPQPPAPPPAPVDTAAKKVAVADTAVKAVAVVDTAVKVFVDTTAKVAVVDTTAKVADTTAKVAVVDTTAKVVDTTAKVVVVDTTVKAVDTTAKVAVVDTTVKAVDTTAKAVVTKDTAAAPIAPPPPAPAAPAPPRPVRTSQIFVPEIEMVFVKGGSFKMGCPHEDNSCIADERPIREVRLNNFRIGKYPVTQKQWGAVMGVIPSHFEGDDLPVEQVSWNEVQEFIRRLNAMTGKRYRLPTEAEWEYAARGGSEGKGQRFWGHRFLDDVAWHDYNSGGKTQPVGTKAPNELGLHDMMGNVWEWVSDWYDRFYYRNSPLKNPTGPRLGSERVYRGQSFKTEEQNCRISMRNYNKPDYKAIDVGFRLVLVD